MYIIAAIYQGIRNRRPSGTPYFNLRFGLTSILALHLFQFAAVLRYYFHQSLIPVSSIAFLVCLIGFSSLSVYLLGILIPQDTLEGYDISKQTAKRANLIFFLYAVVNILILAFLLAAMNPQFKN